MFRKRRFHTCSFWQGFTAEQLPGLGQSWMESSGCARAEAKPAAFIGKPRGSCRDGEEQATGEGSVPQGYPGTLPSSLRPSRLGVLCPQVSLWVTEMTLWGSMGCPPMGFESLPQPGHGQRFVTQL